MKPRTQWDMSWFPFIQPSKQFETHICQAPINKSPSAIHVGQLRFFFLSSWAAQSARKLQSAPWRELLGCVYRLFLGGPLFGASWNLAWKGMGHFPLRLPSAKALIIQVKWIKTNWKASPLDDIAQIQQPALYPHPLTDSWCFDTPCWWYPPCWWYSPTIFVQHVGRCWQILANVTLWLFHIAMENTLW